MTILGIETSCDETAAAVISVVTPRRGVTGQRRGVSNSNEKIKVLSNIVSSQINIHKKYGGVVPEVAAREHVLNIIPVINKALTVAGLPAEAFLPSEAFLPAIASAAAGAAAGAKERRVGLDAIAVTVGPGLITSLQVGVETAKTLAYSWKIPLVGANHIEGHIYANFISTQSTIKFPALILTVSGGHTMLVLMEGHGKYETIGETRDDAAGEAFDKAAKLMDLGYPGGPAVAAEAAKFLNPKSEIRNKSQIQNPKDKNNINLPRPMITSPNFDFSFSGLKTALRYALQSDSDWQNKISEYCHEYQQAIIDVLIKKTVQAAEKYNPKSIMLTGGVAANKKLREQMAKKIKTDFPDKNFLIPKLKYTTDNAVMIAMAGYYKAKRKKFTPWQKIKTDHNLEL